MKLLALFTICLTAFSFPLADKAAAESEEIQETVYRFYVENRSNEIITVIPRLRSGGEKPPRNPSSVRIGIGERKFIGMDHGIVNRTPADTFCEIALQLSRYDYKTERTSYRYHAISLDADDWAAADKQSAFYSYRKHRTFVINGEYIKRVMPKN